MELRNRTIREPEPASGNASTSTTTPTESPPPACVVNLKVDMDDLCLLGCCAAPAWNVECMLRYVLHHVPN